MKTVRSTKKPLAILLGFTGNLAFAAGTLALSIGQHMRGREYEIIMLGTDIEDNDKAIMRTLRRCHVSSYTPPESRISEWSLQLFSSLCLAKFEMFNLLQDYRCVVWLDCDVAVQGDFSDIVAYGPLAMALEDPSLTANNQTLPLIMDFFTPVAEYDMLRPHYNTGVVVLNDTLPDPLRLKEWCLEKLDSMGPNLKYPDQAIFNMLAQEFPHLVKEFPHTRFNAHPRNPASLLAPLVHGFGPYKFWEDGLLSSALPEWRRSYQRWLSMGGSPYDGKVDNLQYYDISPFALLTELQDLANTTQSKLEALELELSKEKKKKLEKNCGKSRVKKAKPEGLCSNLRLVTLLLRQVCRYSSFPGAKGH